MPSVTLCHVYVLTSNCSWSKYHADIRYCSLIRARGRRLQHQPAPNETDSHSIVPLWYKSLYNWPIRRRPVRKACGGSSGSNHLFVSPGKLSPSFTLNAIAINICLVIVDGQSVHFLAICVTRRGHDTMYSLLRSSFKMYSRKKICVRKPYYALRWYNACFFLWTVLKQTYEDVHIVNRPCYA